MTSIRISTARAAAAMRAAARSGLISVMVVAGDNTVNWRMADVEEEIDDLRRAQMIAFEPGLFGHDLLVLMYGLLHRYEVPMPAPEPEPAPVVAEPSEHSCRATELLTEHGSVLLSALRKCEGMLDRHHNDIKWEGEALDALISYMEEHG